MKKLTILVGPPGSGKSTLSEKLLSDSSRVCARVSQDDQGKVGHREVFANAIAAESDIIVDRMNFSVLQRKPYLESAKAAGYTTEIVVLHVPREVCFGRIRERQNHPTIKDLSSAGSALNTFFSKYEKPLEGEADKLTFVYPEGPKPKAIVCDLDGTLCNLDNRLHHVRKPAGEKKNWKAFFDELENDVPHEDVATIIHSFAFTNIIHDTAKIVFASGRPDDYRRKTEEWLKKFHFPTDKLYMRCRGDHREDFIAKEIILDFEILTRFTPLFFIDDRQQVIDLWRRRGYTALQCAKGDF